MNDLWRLNHVNISTANRAMPRRPHTVLDIISEIIFKARCGLCANNDNCHLSKKSGNDLINMAPGVPKTRGRCVGCGVRTAGCGVKKTEK